MANNQQQLSREEFIARMSNRVVRDSSPRNPQIPRHSSHPDRIEAQLQADGHRTWGYVIFRTTYESDAEWTEFLRRLRLWTEHNMAYYNGQDILDLMTWTVFDDKSLFDGASTATVRRHFREWAGSAVQVEQQQPGSDALASMSRSQRYRYCVQVDAESLKSVIEGAPAPLDPEQEYDRENPGWVKLIEKNWAPAAEKPHMARRVQDPEWCESWYGHEPIEGVTEQDVGWVKCSYKKVMTYYYATYDNPNGYSVDYRRPPAVVDFPYI